MNFSQPDKSEVSVRYSTLVYGALITIALTIIGILVANWTHLKFEVRDVIAFVTCGLVTTTLIYTAKNLKLNYDSNRAKLDFDKEKFEYDKRQKRLEYTFQISSQWVQPTMAKQIETARNFMRGNAEKLQNHNPIKDFEDALSNDSEARMALMSILNYFENISLLIKNDLVDESAMKSCFKTLFCDYFKHLNNYIDHLQQKSKRFLMNYEEIAKKWSTD